MVNESELSLIVNGSVESWTIEDLSNQIQWVHGFDKDHKMKGFLTKILCSFNEEVKLKLRFYLGLFYFILFTLILHLISS